MWTLILHWKTFLAELLISSGHFLVAKSRNYHENLTKNLRGKGSLKPIPLQVEFVIYFFQKNYFCKTARNRTKNLKTIKKKTYLHKEINVQFHYAFYLQGAGRAGTRTAYFSGCSFSVLLSWVNAIKVQANAIESWTNAIKVWANDIKIQDQHKQICNHCFRKLII